MTGSYKNLKDNPILLWAIPSDEFIHPCSTDVSALFIKDTVTGDTHCVSFNHPDMISIDKAEITNYLNNYQGKKWAIDKKAFLQLLPVDGLLDFNLWRHIKDGEIIDKRMIDTQAHKIIYRTKKEFGDTNKVIPLVKHKEVFEQMCDVFSHTDTNEIDNGYQRENDTILETLSELESNGIYVDKDCFQQHFNAPVNPDGFVYSQYNIYTSTGRPSNHFDGVNYAALNKEDGSRKCFVSRYGKNGMMVLIDYSAFHPRIICNLVGFEMPIEKDIYKYLGELYFKREVNEYDMAEVKSITMRQLYGGVEDKYEQMTYFKSLKQFIDMNWKKFSSDGYINTPVFGRKITNLHLKDANPNKLFNYILQATETEISMTAIKQVNRVLKDRKTKPVLYTYDSVLFDFYKPDGIETIGNVITLMKMCNRFPIKVYVGDSYDSVAQMYP
jgi:hypothetical protein